MAHETIQALLHDLAPAARVDEQGQLHIVDEVRLRAAMDWLQVDGTFGPAPVKSLARWIVWEAGQALYAQPESINDFYMARGEGKYGALTVPAMNIRGLPYPTMRAAFRAALKRNVGAMIFEIARSEMGYCDLRPAEYTMNVIAAALREGFRGPLFIQGDHFQVSLKAYGKDPEKELQIVRDLIDEALEGGFFNIDIDTSTLVDLDKATLPEQQYLNYSLAAQLSKYIRDREPAGITVSLGGEIGEVGGHNSTVDELRAYMDGYNAELEKLAPASTGLSKISIQTGTAHGGVVMADGSLASVKIDFDVLRELSNVARDEYGMGGAVQHGASTLPDEMFRKFAEEGACEVHLATGFQTTIFNHPALPAHMKQAVRDYVFAHLQSERGAKDSDEQFVYKAGKKTWGPLKAEWAMLSEADLAPIMQTLEDKFGFLFEQLGVVDTVDLVQTYVTSTIIHKPLPAEDVAEVVGFVETATDLAD